MKVLCGYRKCGLGCAVVRAEPDTLTLAARRSVLGLSAYATKIGRSLVPASAPLHLKPAKPALRSVNDGLKTGLGGKPGYWAERGRKPRHPECRKGRWRGNID